MLECSPSSAGGIGHLSEPPSWEESWEFGGVVVQKHLFFNFYLNPTDNLVNIS